MRFDEPAAPSIGAVPGTLPDRTILPFAAERARAAPIEPDPLAAFAAARFLGSRTAPPFAEAFSTKTAPPAPAPTPRQQALRDRLIVTTAARGAELMRQVAEGVLPAHRAFADFSSALERTDISAKARAQLRGDFVAGLRKAERSRGPERVAPPVPVSQPMVPIEMPPGVEAATLAAARVERLINEDAAQIEREGKAVPELTFREVAETLGVDRARQWRRDRVVSMRLHAALLGLAELSAAEIEYRISRLKPPVGADDDEIGLPVWRSARQRADEILQERLADPAAAVARNPSVMRARAAYESEATAKSSVALSEALISAQERIAIPVHRQSPLTRDEEAKWADIVLKLPADARPAAIRRLAVHLQQTHGQHADLALRAIARHWSGDAKSAAFAAAIAAHMDDAEVLLPGSEEASKRREWSSLQDEPSTADAGGNAPPHAPPLRLDPSEAEHAAHSQRAPASVRDSEGNFVHGEPLGDAVEVEDKVGFRQPNGSVQLVDDDRHVVLFDAQSGRWLVFRRTFRNDQVERGVIWPKVRNLRTGEVDWGVPESAVALIDAFTLPRDVVAGRVDPNSEEALRRAVDFTGLVGSSTLTKGLRARPRTRPWAAARQASTLEITPGSPVVQVKTTPTRSSNAKRGTPEWDMLNNPEPLTIYKLDNGESFRTNAFGYVSELIYKPTRDSRGRNARQTRVGKQGLSTDVGGHVRSRNTGGSGDRYNLFPQDANFNSSAYRKWEIFIENNLDNVEVIRTTFIRVNKNSARPDELLLEWVIDGKLFRERFVNRKGGK